MPHIAIASGGTGGHFYPTLAIAEAAVRAGDTVTLFVAGHHAAEQLAIARERGLDAVPLPASRLPRSIPAALTFPFRFARSVFHGFRALGRTRPDVVLGMGSFAAVPLCLGAVLRRLPLVLHEGNALMGRANRILSRWARAAATSLPMDEAHLPRCPTVRTGMPLRQALLEAARNHEPPSPALYTEFGLDPAVPTVLVFGGSQGARFINSLLAESVRMLTDRAAPPIQFIHLTGTDDNASLEAAYASAGLRARVARSDSRIERCYRVAGLVICRGGASSLSELALFRKPGIIIPLPTAADDHQSVNARILEQRGAIRQLPQAEANGQKLAALLEDWLSKRAAWDELARRIGELACPEAAEAVVRLLHAPPGTP